MVVPLGIEQNANEVGLADFAVMFIEQQVPK